MIIVLLDRVDDGRDMRGSAGRIIHPDCAQLSGIRLNSLTAGVSCCYRKAPERVPRLEIGPALRSAARASLRFAGHSNFLRSGASRNWVQRADLNRRPSGYEPDELPGCSTLQ